MGMFDWVACYAPLPEECGFTFVPYLHAQTKSLEREMARYVISAPTDDEPSLLLSEIVDTEEHPTLGLRLDQPMWDIEWIPKKEVTGRHQHPVDFSGEMEFHHWAAVAGEETTAVWLSFSATFADGVLDRITLREQTEHKVEVKTLPGIIKAFPLYDPSIAWRLGDVGVAQE